ncbi:hypothetical protein NG798_02690 [Ancylothrix sp. C2]|uniref:hypothetical protein n=1 Tax=Ancylothrix sp. D3o TaxID=2953691 RepID=UPI0021BB21B2|nr:hypothetical protein [Ancylothrix sp. D3o]MCT7948688.1 hypothetical protein [Ancylothrix sp. D3o]
MAKSVDRIERELAELQQAVTTLAEEFKTVYLSYLKVLGAAVRQQLVLAGYHLCTRVYPESFLKLSYSQRQQFQKDLRLLGKNAEDQLMAVLDSPAFSESASEVSLPVVGLPVELTAEQAESIFNPYSLSSNISSEQTQPDFIRPNLESISQEAPVGPILPPPASTTAPAPAPAQEMPINEPGLLLKWQLKSERAIGKVLQSTSRKGNRLLQQSDILPKKMPEQLLEAAAKADAEGAVAGPPNLLNLLVEAGDASDESAGSMRSQLMAIHLRLSEVEFADAGAMGLRNQIRALERRLSQLGREFQKKQRELAVAQAESAWRACWFED